MIARKLALIIVVQILTGLLGYVGLFFITKYMTPSDYGIVAFAMGFVAIFAIVGELGFASAHIKKISEGRDFGTCNGTYLSIKAVLIILMLVVTLLSLFIWQSVLGNGFESVEQQTAIYVMILYWLIQKLCQCFTTTFRAKKEIAKSQLPALVDILVKTILTIYVAIGGYGAIALAYTYIAGSAVSLIASIFLFKGYPIKKPNLAYIKEYTAFSLPLILVVISATILSNTDKVLIQLFWSSEDVGYYFSAFRLSGLAGMFAGAVGILLFPTFSTLYTNNDHERIKDLLFSAERYLSMLIFPMTFGIIILADPIVRIMLSGWMPVVPILQVLTLVALFTTLEMPYQSQFLGMNHPKLARNRIIVMIAVNILLNLYLIPINIQSIGLTCLGLGARGAAIATTISYIIGFVYSRIKSYQLTGIKGNPRILIHMFASLIMSGILYCTQLYVTPTRWYELAVFVLVGSLIYFGLLYLLREFTKDDFHFFVDTINVKEMFRYIKNEIRE